MEAELNYKLIREHVETLFRHFTCPDNWMRNSYWDGDQRYCLVGKIGHVEDNKTFINTGTIRASDTYKFLFQLICRDYGRFACIEDFNDSYKHGYREVMNLLTTALTELDTLIAKETETTCQVDKILAELSAEKSIPAPEDLVTVS